MYNPSTSVHFQIYSNDHPDLIVKILYLAGISTEDDELYSLAQNEDSENIQQENKH